MLKSQPPKMLVLEGGALEELEFMRAEPFPVGFLPDKRDSRELRSPF